MALKGQKVIRRGGTSSRRRHVCRCRRFRRSPRVEEWKKGKGGKKKKKRDTQKSEEKKRVSAKFNYTIL